jgi:hypothetical protein
MALSHNIAKQYIEKALDGRLSSSGQERLDEHLADCPTCRTHAQQWTQFDVLLARSLAGLGAAPPASGQRLTETVTMVEAYLRRDRIWQPFRFGGRLALNAALLVALIAAAFIFLRPPETAVNDLPQTPEPNDQITALTSDYVVVHFDFVGSADEIEMVHPACDGMAHMPDADQLAELTAGGETPHCELIASNTLLFKPGEARQILLIYRNGRDNEINLSLTPRGITDWERPFAQAICDADNVNNGQICADYNLAAGAVWARFVELRASEMAQLGSSIVIQFDVRAQELAIR